MKLATTNYNYYYYYGYAFDEMVVIATNLKIWTKIGFITITTTIKRIIGSTNRNFKTFID